MSAEEQRLRSALHMALVAFEQLTDPDPQRGLLTNVKLQGEQQGVNLSATYDACVDLVAVLRAELGESDEGIDDLGERLQARSVGQQMADLADAVLEALERVEIVAQADDMEDLDRARADLREALNAR